jgi:hypothetical protein
MVQPDSSVGPCLGSIPRGVAVDPDTNDARPKTVISGNGKVTPGLGSCRGSIHRLNLLASGAYSGVADRPGENTARQGCFTLNDAASGSTLVYIVGRLRNDLR